MKELTVSVSETGFPLAALIVKLFKLHPEKTCVGRKVVGFTQYLPRVDKILLI